MNVRPLGLALLVGLGLLAGCGNEDTPDAPTHDYNAEIRWTSYGIPHIIADDMPSAAFGQGYAFAKLDGCILADQIVKLRLQIDRYFVLMGSIQETGTREFLESRTQLERDEILVATLDELDFEGAGHLGVDRFTVSTGSEPSLGAAKLESGINALLVEEIG